MPVLDRDPTHHLVSEFEMDRVEMWHGARVPMERTLRLTDGPCDGYTTTVSLLPDLLTFDAFDISGRYVPVWEWKWQAEQEYIWLPDVDPSISGGL